MFLLDVRCPAMSQRLSLVLQGAHDKGLLDSHLEMRTMRIRMMALLEGSVAKALTKPVPYRPVSKSVRARGVHIVRCVLHIRAVLPRVRS